MRHAFLIAGCLVALSFSMAFSREWTDDTGKYHVEAEFLSHRAAEEVVVLKRTNGRRIAVPIARLSQHDRDYIEAAADTLSPTRYQDLFSAPTAPDLSTLQANSLISDRRLSVGATLLANAVLGRANQPPEALPPAPTDNAAADRTGQSRMATRSFRYIYNGCNGHFHLCPDKQGVGAGTALYWWPPHHCRIHLLDYLTYEFTKGGFFVYRASPNSPVKRWAFSVSPWLNGCYHVWYQPSWSNYFFLYEYTSRERVF